MKVLIYPAGTEIGLEVARSLRYQKGIEVIGANSQRDHSYFMFEKLFKVSDIYKDPYKAIAQIKRIVITEKVDFVFPTHDQVIYEFSNVNIKEVIVPDSITAGICRSKSNTYIFFKDQLPCPVIYSPSSVEFPVFLKPDQGQGSRGTWIANNRDELKRRKDELMLEYLPGEEYTIDCFTDRHRKLRYVGSRKRSRISNGISVCTERVEDPVLNQFAEIINKSLTFRGQWFFQVKKNKEGIPVLMEIAARAAGSSNLARGRGVNLPLLTLYDRMDKDIEIIENDFVRFTDRALDTKYGFEYVYNNVYVDLDDTLIHVIGLIHKLKQQGKKIHLLTRHEGVICETLDDMNINPDLFDSLIKTTVKKNFIDKPAIFIDDSFKERKAVFKATGIPVFDVQQAIEVL
jgi:hypothetical protein